MEKEIVFKKKIKGMSNGEFLFGYINHLGEFKECIILEENKPMSETALRIHNSIMKNEKNKRGKKAF